MNKTFKYLAFDFGAESGRAVLGFLAEGKIRLEEIHRFPTEGIMMLGTRQWDITRIYGEMLTSLRKCAKEYGPDLDGIGVDTWGVDFGLVAKDGSIMGNPTHYRDKRTDGMMDEAFKIMPREEIYAETGIQFMQLNTIFQLLSMAKAKAPVLEVADSLLMMNDLFSYLLCGVRACEYTNATTTQLLDPMTKNWNDKLIAKLGLPRDLLLKPTAPGTVLGKILPEVAALTGISPDVPVIAAAGHDTADAVAAVPAEKGEGNWAFLSSGTWSLFGAELDAPIVSDATLAASFTNEGGMGEKITFLTNIIGLWLVQECRRSWLRAGDKVTYGEMVSEAVESKAFASVIDVDDPSLLAPDDMPTAIKALCRKTRQPEPESRGAMVRCALESLTLKYRRTLRDLDKVLGRKTQRLHIIGGGTQNKLLSQMAADACGIPVIAGPVEATALGNISIQAIGTGAMKDMWEARATIAKSFDVEHYTPENTAAWDAVEAKFGK